MKFSASRGPFNGFFKYLLSHGKKEYIKLNTSGNYFDNGVSERSPWIVFDYENAGTRWASNGKGDSPWIEIKIIRYALKINKYTVRSVDQYYCIQGLRVDASYDYGLTYTMLDEVPFTTEFYEFNPYVKEVNESSFFNTFRFTMIGKTAKGDTTMRISSIELFGTADIGVCTNHNPKRQISIVFFIIQLLISC